MRRILLALAIAVCAGTAAADEKHLVLPRGSLATYWSAIPSEEKRTIPRALLRQHMNACVAVAYTIEADGRAANIRILRTITSKPGNLDAEKLFQDFATAPFAKTHYEPTAENADRKPVFTYAVVPLAVSNVTTAPAVADRHMHEVEQQCEIADFVAAVGRGDIPINAAP
jgi:hypothetical protein